MAIMRKKSTINLEKYELEMGELKRLVKDGASGDTIIQAINNASSRLIELTDKEERVTDPFVIPKWLEGDFLERVFI